MVRCSLFASKSEATSEFWTDISDPVQKIINKCQLYACVLTITNKFLLLEDLFSDISLCKTDREPESLKTKKAGTPAVIPVKVLNLSFPGTAMVLHKGFYNLVKEKI